jgi:predicted peroxiredoxin
LHGNALAEAGHEVQIFLLGEAVSLMRDPLANAVIPVGWPPLAETLQKTISLGIPIHV